MNFCDFIESLNMMGLVVSRKMATNLAVRRKNWQTWPFSRKKEFSVTIIFYTYKRKQIDLKP